MQNVTSIILGGGQGSRLFPLTLQRSKPAVSFMGKFRLIDIPISNCINSNLRRVFVLTQFLSASLHRHIMQTYQFDTFSDGFVDILAAEQTLARSDWFQGTADAVRATLPHTSYYPAEQMLILGGDHLYRMDYRKLIQFHREKGADITVCVQPIPKSDAARMGLTKVDAEGRITDFAEKPRQPEVIDRFLAPDNMLSSLSIDKTSDLCLASMGIYVFETEVLKRVLACASKTDFGGQVIPSAIHTERVMAYPFTGYWRDIGTITAFFEANIELAQRSPAFPIYDPGWPIYTRSRSLPPSRIIESQIQDCILVEGSDITGASISDSIIGMRSNVRAGSVLKEVVMTGADFYDGERLVSLPDQPEADLPRLGIGRDCRIERAIIDKNARIGDRVVIRSRVNSPDSQEKYCWVRDGISIIPKGCVIPNDTVL
ncbi:MAG: glucose-1-phosphate adenylyltransferase [Planctomycetota bacterium]